MSRTQRWISASLTAVLMLATFATPAMAFEGREGDQVIVAAGEVVNDDLYVGATKFDMDGIVNGDVIAAGQIITINGTINGNLVAAAQTLVVNGTVKGDILAAGSVLLFDEAASIGGDIIGAGYSFELRKGVKVGRDAVIAAAQILMAADVERNLTAGAGALEIAATIGGDVRAAIGEATAVQAGPPPTIMMPPSPVGVPVVRQGLTIDQAAQILGDLEYTQDSELSFPSGVVHGKISRLPQPREAGENRPAPTAADRAGQWAVRSIRSLVTLILLSLLLLWLAPIFLRALSQHLSSEPWSSLGWGVVAYAGFFFLLLLVVFVSIIGAVLLGLLTLGGLSATVAWVGILLLFILILAFVLATAYLAKIVFGMTVGRWILSSAKSPLAEHRYWPTVIGVTLTVVIIALLTFPLLPGLLGWLVNFAIVLFGLGTVWLWARHLILSRPTTDL